MRKPGSMRAQCVSRPVPTDSERAVRHPAGGALASTVSRARGAAVLCPVIAGSPLPQSQESTRYLAVQVGPLPRPGGRPGNERKVQLGTRSEERRVGKE